MPIALLSGPAASVPALSRSVEGQTPTPSATVVPEACSARAGTTQFMEISSGVHRDGSVYLGARLARKEILGESFETVPTPGPYTEVEMPADGSRQLLLNGGSGTAESLVQALGSRTEAQVGRAST